jgi:hypothetical protein
VSRIVKRKLRQSWRDAVEARIGASAPRRVEEGVSRFDAAVARGTGEAEAAYATLASLGLLWEVEAPGFTRPAESPDGRPDSGSVPSV